MLFTYFFNSRPTVHFCLFLSLDFVSLYASFTPIDFLGDAQSPKCVTVFYVALMLLIEPHGNTQGPN